MPLNPRSAISNRPGARPTPRPIPALGLRTGPALALAGLVLALLAGALPADAREQLVFAGGRVSLDLPAGFTRMSQELIDTKYPRGSAPEHAFSNAATTVSLAGGYTANAGLTRERLPEFREFMESNLERTIPGLRWISRGIVDIAGWPWIRLELLSNAIDTEIHNVMLMTELDGGMAGVNFNATVGEWEAYREALAASEGSLRVKP
jgi:hypothetical protein